MLQIPMLLEQFAARNRDLPFEETVSPLRTSNCVSNGDAVHDREEDQTRISTPPTTPKTSLANFSSKTRFEAAARKNKERIDQERSRGAAFLDCEDGTAAASEADNPGKRFPLEEDVRNASPSSRQDSERHIGA
ncbi:hypothetical protein PHYSODRAFT_298671 [Phytophthora sojae]|uniref:Uncharacterized protein n=1 Tax=Phytophthora sojae (strain P6497) TaxID=1094619 RepID=G4ZBK3_PHYSP|nr:hypothetical protein PHYSODRAFT_298671 [Phytophthora sojae]EGZ20617.1 hypothetical protein PHYSODRAFT_298671 [Phytophthora sojae]|eukprot:XP_009523334.1 hypothetical protein PHYSODRAFT_298671 [Phytophthora sojae]